MHLCSLTGSLPKPPQPVESYPREQLANSMVYTGFNYAKLYLFQCGPINHSEPPQSQMYN